MNTIGPGQAMFAFVRHWSRRSADDPRVAENGRLVLVTEAVLCLERHGVEATVNAVAEEIGLDQSGASRLMAAATDAGWLTLDRSPADARRRHATVTPHGHTMLKHAHAWQERVFDQLTATWTARRREAFGTAFADLLERAHTLDP